MAIAGTQRFFVVVVRQFRALFSAFVVVIEACARAIVDADWRLSHHLVGVPQAKSERDIFF
jgi:hypothetical protein